MTNDRFGIFSLVLRTVFALLFPATILAQQPGIQKAQIQQRLTLELTNDGKIRLHGLDRPFGQGLLRPLFLDRGFGNYCLGGDTAKTLPAWFYDLDTDEDGQISLKEWRTGDKKFAEFRPFDLNDDGYITDDEVLRFLRRPIALKLEKGQAEFTGAIEPSDEKYLGKKLAKIITIHLEPGKTYQIDHKSKAFDAYLYLEDPDGELLAQNDDGGEGLNARIVYRATQFGVHRVIATSVGNSRPGAFSLSIRALNRIGGVLPKALPTWFQAADKDEDGQIELHEWRAAGKPLGQFRDYDLNDDGFITAEEAMRFVKHPLGLKFENGLATCNASLVEASDERHRGKKAFKIFTINLEAGKTYQIDHISKVFQAFLYLEDADGEMLMEHSSRTIGDLSRLIFRANKTGTYRIVATSLGGFRTGDFVFSVRVLGQFAAVLPKGLPTWFKDYDQDADGQITLLEWRQGGKLAADFREYDRNDDGFITPMEAMPLAKRPFELKLVNGHANYAGAIEEPDEKYRDKKAYKSISIKLEEGRTYQIESVSQAYYAYLYLEDGDGNVLAKHNSGGRGQTSRIVYLAARTGIYRLIATSQDGYKTGDFALTVSVVDR